MSNLAAALPRRPTRKRKPRTKGNTKAPAVQAPPAAQAGPQAGPSEPPAARPPGRPPSITTPVTQAQITRMLENIAVGVPLRHAAALQDLEVRTVEDWLLKGTGTDRTLPEPRYAAFAVAVAKARAQAFASRVANMRLVAKGGQVISRRELKRHGKNGQVVQTIVEETFAAAQWTPDAWWCERQGPEEFGRKVAVQHGGEVGIIDYAAICREAYRRATEKRQARLVGASSSAAPAALPAAAPTDGHPGGGPPP